MDRQFSGIIDAEEDNPLKTFVPFSCRRLSLSGGGFLGSLLPVIWDTQCLACLHSSCSARFLPKKKYRLKGQTGLAGRSLQRCLNPACCSPSRLPSPLSEGPFPCTQLSRGPHHLGKILQKKSQLLSAEATYTQTLSTVCSFRTVQNLSTWPNYRWTSCQHASGLHAGASALPCAGTCGRRRRLSQNAVLSGEILSPRQVLARESNLLQ